MEGFSLVVSPSRISRIEPCCSERDLGRWHDTITSHPFLVDLGWIYKTSLLSVRNQKGTISVSLATVNAQCFRSLAKNDWHSPMACQQPNLGTMTKSLVH